MAVPFNRLAKQAAGLLAGVCLFGAANVCAQEKQPAQAPKPECAPVTQDADPAAFRAAYLQFADKPELMALVDQTHALTPTYQPADLTFRTRGLREEASYALEAMQKAAWRQKINLKPLSAFRPYEHQRQLSYFRRSDQVARPGHSQHQLGTAVDFNTLRQQDENLPALVWLREHAGEYGFSLSFPKGEEAETGYPYEPWHYRYISREGVKFQDEFFGGSQHKMLVFLYNCLWKNNAEENAGRPEAAFRIVETEPAAREPVQSQEEKIRRRLKQEIRQNTETQGETK